jgi:hypothetical protein
MDRKGLKAYKATLQMPQELLGILTGTLLGDAWVMKNTTGYNAAWEHENSQKQYTEYKMHLLYPLCMRTEAMYLPRINGWRGGTLVHPMFEDLRNKFYPLNKKVVTEEILNYLNAPGLACWYMDDGWAQSTSYMIATSGFTLDEHHIIRKFLREKFGLYTNICPCELKTSRISSFGHPKVNRIIYNLYIVRKSVQRFEELIGPYICPSMEYKFRRYLQNPQRLYAEIVQQSIIR